MISIVFSSKNPEEGYMNHLINSCGVKEVDLIPVKNEGLFSLVDVYNNGLKKAKYDTVVFVHDDVAFNTKSWGYKILKHFEKNPEYGIIGLAGTERLHDGMWWRAPQNMFGKVYHQKDGKRWESKYSPTFGNSLVEVVAVDGVFMTVRKDRIKKPFNNNFQGFHFYDIPICVDNYLEGVKIGVCSNIELTHFSVGQTNNQWNQNKQLFESLYQEHLPLMVNREINVPQTPKFKWENNTPKVSIIIPTKDKLELIIPCLDSIYEKTTYPNFEIIVADTGSTDENKTVIKNYVSTHENIRLIEFNYYNFAKINNEVVNQLTNPELLLFCNNDIELLNDTISIMTNTYIKKKDAGIIGSRLHYKDNSIQHNGIGLTVKVETGLFFTTHLDSNKTLYYNESIKDVLGVTGAHLMVSYDKFIEFGMFNEEYTECFEDVELCLSSLSKGYKNYIVPQSVAYHYESVTRKVKDNEDSIQNNFKDILMPFIIKNIDNIRKYLTVIR